MQNKKPTLGPATLVTAAFIGPGTVTLCTLAGVNHGTDLLWALLLSIIATIYIQNTAARMSFSSGMGLVSVVRQGIPQKLLRIPLLLLIVSAIFVGNTAYEAGNISGAVLGLDQFIENRSLNLGGLSLSTGPLLIGLVVSLLIIFGNIELLKKLLIAIVILMSISFVMAAVLSAPSFSAILSGIFKPSLNAENTLTVVGLVGTTVVPYNLFLHAALVKDAADQGYNQKDLQKDTFIAVALGGLISMAIIIASSAVQGADIQNAADLGLALKPLLGDSAVYLISAGLFAAGLSSAMTAPLAAAYVIGESMDLNKGEKSPLFKGIALFVLLIGILFASASYKPIEIIRFAQIANGLLLPIVGIFIFWMVNRSKLMHAQRPSLLQNICNLIIILFFIFLGVKSLGLIY